MSFIQFKTDAPTLQNTQVTNTQKSTQVTNTEKTALAVAIGTGTALLGIAIQTEQTVKMAVKYMREAEAKIRREENDYGCCCEIHEDEDIDPNKRDISLETLVKEVGQELLSSCKALGYKTLPRCEFKILYNQHDLNAFTTLNGDICITYDYVQLLLKAEDSDLTKKQKIAVPLAHEIGHLLPGHNRLKFFRLLEENFKNIPDADVVFDRRWAPDAVNNILKITYLKAASQITYKALKPFFHEQEYAADTMAFRVLYAAGYDANKCIEQHFQYIGTHLHESKLKDSTSHPAWNDRANKLKTWINLANKLNAKLSELKQQQRTY